ncbi:BQ2448_483 [Microbotryum intermedium]|uniref:BQ2448_483 protein n=1 Tax=Microbotryum intermedium TaxID=269621 RepID=A0A238F2K0_9BASI|nr:BQ2448_483 [Microbotryum intermedium]
MWQEDSPWGSADDSLPSSTSLPRRPPSPLPSLSSFTATSNPVTSGGWGDDGGWGTSVDESAAVTSVASTSAVTLDEEGAGKLGRPRGEVELELGQSATTIEKIPEPVPMWTPPTTSMTVDDSSRYDGDHSTGIATITTNDSSLALPPLGSLEPTEPSTSTGEDTETYEEAEAGGGEDGGWGEHGASPVLPPIATLRVDDVEPDLDLPDKGWGGDDDGWVPPEVPEPLPTFGDIFGKPTTRRESVEEGWGGSTTDAVPSWNGQGEEREQKGADLDRRESEASGEGWGGEIDDADLNPEADAQPDQGDEDSLLDGLPTPISATRERDETTSGSVFRQASAYKDGLQKTAARTAETIQSSSAAAAIRNAGTTSFGRRTVSASDHAQGSAAEESDGSTKAPVKSSWWGSKLTSEATTAAANPSSPPPRTESPSTEETSAAGPSRLGRLFGRLRRNPGGSNEGASASEPSEDLPPEWKPKDLDALDTARRLSPSRSDFTSRTAPLDDFFHDMPGKTTRVPTAPPVDDFGLLGAFSEAPLRPSSRFKKSPQPHDPFDPFADHNEPTVAAPSAFNNSRNGGVASSTFSSPSSFSMVSPPPASSSRVNSFANNSQRLGSPTIAAPRARTEQSEDSFDTFFDSVASSNKKPALTTTTYEDFDLAMPTPRAGPRKAFAVPPPSILPRANFSPGPSLISPPLRAASASPTIVNPLAPPPPPSQPLANRHLISELARPASSTGFNAQQRSASPAQAATSSTIPAPLLPPPPPGMGVVPLAPSPVGSIKRPNAPSVTIKAPAPSKGPLSPDDFSFFES